MPPNIKQSVQSFLESSEWGSPDGARVHQRTRGKREEDARRAAGIANAGGAARPRIANGAPVPSLLDDPEYAELDARLTELKTEFAGLEREISDAVMQVNAQSTSERQRQISSAAALTSRPTDRGIATQFSAESARRTLEETQARRALVRDAIRLQEQLVLAARNRATKAALAAARPHHERLVERLTLAALELARAAEEEQDYRTALEANGLLVGEFAQAVPPGAYEIGRLTNEMSAIRRHLDRLAHFGYPVPQVPELARDVRRSA